MKNNVGKVTQVRPRGLRTEAVLAIEARYAPLPRDVRAILGAVTIPVQLGGGIRTLDHIENWLSRGLARVILGTVAVRDPALVIEACKQFPGKVAVGIRRRAEADEIESGRSHYALLFLVGKRRIAEKIHTEL